MRHVIEDLNKANTFVALEVTKPNGNDTGIQLQGPGIDTYHVTARDGKLKLVKGELPKIERPKAERKAAAKAAAPAGDKA